MPTIRFLRKYTVQDQSGTSYAAGDLLECGQATANHFLDRQAAELVVAPAVEAKQPEAPESSKLKGKPRGKQDEPTGVQQ